MQLARLRAMHRELKARLFARACDIVGGREALAQRLDVEPHALEFWLAARATPPERVFLLVVDLVLADDIARAAQDRRKDAVQRSAFALLPERTETMRDAKAP